MDLERMIQKEFDALSETETLPYIKEGNRKSVMKEWGNMALGIEVEQDGNRSRYLLKYNRNQLEVEAVHHEGYKEYARYRYKLGDKPWQDIKPPTFMNRLKHFLQVTEFYRYLIEDKRNDISTNR